MTAGHTRSPYAPEQRTPGSRTSRRLHVEGLRGLSTRMSTRVRYFAYWLAILVGSALIHGIFKAIPGAQSGGVWMAMSIAFQITVAAVGTLFFAHRRREIIDEVVAYVFGYTLGPGLGIAAFAYGATVMVQGGSEDMFLRTLTSMLPWLYFLPVVIPAFIFVKVVSGYRVVDRVALDDEEMMRMWTRNDGIQR